MALAAMALAAMSLAAWPTNIAFIFRVTMRHSTLQYIPYSPSVLYVIDAMDSLTRLHGLQSRLQCMESCRILELILKV